VVTGPTQATTRPLPNAPCFGSERGPVALPVFKIGRSPLDAGGLGSTPRRFRQFARLRPARAWKPRAMGLPPGPTPGPA